MLPHKFRVGEIFGIPLYLDFSLTLLLILFITDARSITNAESITDAESFALGLGLALALLVSITLHELGHSLTARLFGYNAREITLSLLGGCASFIALPRKAYQEFLTALAGPLVSFAIAGCAWAALLFLPITNPWTETVIDYTLLMNVTLGGFNLLPGFPLDGGRIFRSATRLFLSRTKATYVAMVVGRGVAILIGLRGLWSLFNGGSWGFISLMIAWMIWKEGYREYRAALAEESWRRWDYSARVSPPPYGGDADDVEIHRDK